MVVLAYVAAEMIDYSVSSYKSNKNVEVLREKVGEALTELTVDAQTGKPVVVAAKAPEPVPRVTQEIPILDKYKELYEMNNDLAGWISIEGTNVNYPVMQTVFDEEYYLHRNFDKEEDKEGLPFVDYRADLKNRSTNIIIYGHNMKNGHMFHDLLEYEDEDFLNDHKYIRFDTVRQEAIYEITAVFRSKVMYMTDDAFKFYNFIQADDESELEDFLQTTGSMSLYPITAQAMLTDELITLSTCEYSEEDGRFVVVARRVEEKGN